MIEVTNFLIGSIEVAKIQAFILLSNASNLSLTLCDTHMMCNRWGCPPSKFPWTYEAKETCYLLEGKVKVFPSGSNESVEIAAGDLVVFPKGMSCTWDVSVGVDKHYNFE